MMAGSIYKILGRYVEDRAYFVIEEAAAHNHSSRVTSLREEFGNKWDIWSERFPEEHPHAALQRRLHAHVNFKPKHVTNATPPLEGNTDQSTTGSPPGSSESATEPAGITDAGVGQDDSPTEQSSPEQDGGAIPRMAEG